MAHLPLPCFVRTTKPSPAPSATRKTKKTNGPNSTERFSYETNEIFFAIHTHEKGWVQCRSGNRFGIIKGHHLIKCEVVTPLFTSRFLARNVSGRWFCGQCGSEFCFKKQFSYHVRNYPFGDCKGKDKCGECGLVFRAKSQAKLHTTAKCRARLVLKRVNCRFCGKQILNPDTLRKHEAKQNCRYRDVLQKLRVFPSDGGDESPPAMNDLLVMISNNEGLEQLKAIISEAKLGDLPQVLAQRLTDNNAKIAQTTVELCQQIAIAMGPPCKQYVRFWLPAIVKGLGEDSDHRSACIACMNSMFDQAGYKELFKHNIIADALETGCPALKNCLLGWLAEKLPVISTEDIENDVLNPILQQLYANICDRNANMRRNANKAILAFMAYLPKIQPTKWTFTTPREDFTELLKKQISSAAFVNKEQVANMFHDDFRYHLTVIDDLIENLFNIDVGLISNLDLIMQWFSLRFYDANSLVLLKGLHYLKLVFQVLIEKQYVLTQNEGISFVPHLLAKICYPEDVVRMGVRSLLRQIILVYPIRRVFVFIVDALKSKKVRQRAECLDELGYLIETYGLEVCQPTQQAALNEIARHISDRFQLVQNAALNTIMKAYFLVGEEVYKLIGQVSEKDLNMLMKYIKKRSNVTKPSDPIVLEVAMEQPAETTGTRITVGSMAMVARDTHPEDDQEMQVKANDVVFIYNKRDHNWLLATSGEAFGLVHKNNLIPTVQQYFTTAPEFCTCGRKMGNVERFTLHKKQYPEGQCKENPRLFICEECAKQFATASKLKRHAIKHSVDKPIPCEHCNSKFKHPQALKQHMVQRHPEAKPLAAIFTCECGKQFANASMLKKHAIKHSVDKPIPCEHCNSKFTDPRNLRQHMLQRHPEAKPLAAIFTCEDCGKQFATASKLKEHAFKHSVDKTIPCEHCNSKFKHPRCLRRHMLQSHPEAKPLAAVEPCEQWNEVMEDVDLEFIGFSDEKEIETLLSSVEGMGGFATPSQQQQLPVALHLGTFVQDLDLTTNPATKLQAGEENDPAATEVPILEDRISLEKDTLYKITFPSSNIQLIIPLEPKTTGQRDEEVIPAAATVTEVDQLGSLIIPLEPKTTGQRDEEVIPAAATVTEVDQQQSLGSQPLSQHSEPTSPAMDKVTVVSEAQPVHRQPLPVTMVTKLVVTGYENELGWIEETFPNIKPIIPLEPSEQLEMKSQPKTTGQRDEEVIPAAATVTEVDQQQSLGSQPLSQHSEPTSPFGGMDGCVPLLQQRQQQPAVVPEPFVSGRKSKQQYVEIRSAMDKVTKIGELPLKKLNVLVTKLVVAPTAVTTKATKLLARDENVPAVKRKTISKAEKRKIKEWQLDTLPQQSTSTSVPQPSQNKRRKQAPEPFRNKPQSSQPARLDRAGLNSEVRPTGETPQQPTSRRFTCDLCGNSLSTKQILQDHMASVHRKGKPRFTCRECGKQFRTRPVCLKHERGHRREFVCDLCGRSFQQKGNLIRHTRLKHESR